LETPIFDGALIALMLNAGMDFHKHALGGHDSVSVEGYSTD
jgi:hypothetical protein